MHTMGLYGSSRQYFMENTWEETIITSCLMQIFANIISLLNLTVRHWPRTSAFGAEGCYLPASLSVKKELRRVASGARLIGACWRREAIRSSRMEGGCPSSLPLLLVALATLLHSLGSPPRRTAAAPILRSSQPVVSASWSLPTTAAVP